MIACRLHRGGTYHDTYKHVTCIAGVPSSRSLLGFPNTAPPPVCGPAVIGALAVWRQNNKKTIRGGQFSNTDGGCGWWQTGSAGRFSFSEREVLFTSTVTAFFFWRESFFGGIFFPLPSTLLVTVTELREQGSTVATGPKSERASNRS